MKCFLTCFSTSKRQNHFSSKPSYTTIQFQPTHHETDLEESIHWISQSKIENEEEKSQCVNNTGDLETKEEKITTPQSQCCIIENKDNHEEEEEKQECSDSLFSVSISCGKPVSIEENAENEVNSTPIKLHHAKDDPKSEEQPNEAKDFDEKARPMNQYILEYRYQDCSVDINLDDEDLCNEKTGEEEEEEEERSSESSLFSLSTDYNNCRKRISFSSTTEKEVSSKMVPTQEDNDDVCSSVLKPIENVAKATVLHSVKKDKENMNWNEADNSLKVSSSNRKMKEKEEIGVDTSLSSWLVESENHTPKKVCYGEDRSILGELKVEKIRKYSPNVSSKSSTSLSPEETPIIGTVGSYWNHSGSSKSNKFGKDGKQDWSSTIIVKTRLEPAFEASVAQNYVQTGTIF